MSGGNCSFKKHQLVAHNCNHDIIQWGEGGKKHKKTKKTLPGKDGISREKDGKSREKDGISRTGFLMDFLGLWFVFEIAHAYIQLQHFGSVWDLGLLMDPTRGSSSATLVRGCEITKRATMSLESDPKYKEMLAHKHRLEVASPVH